MALDKSNQPDIPPIDEPAEKSLKGQFFPHLRPRECSYCTHGIKVNAKAIYLDVRNFTENGWLPATNKLQGREHWYWILCSPSCLYNFSLSVQQKKVDLDTE